MLNQTTINEAVGNLIKKYRSENSDLTQEEFARRVGLSRPSVVNIEKGRQQVSVYQLLLFANTLGVQPSLLIPNLHQKEDSNISSNLPEDVDESIKTWFGMAVESK